jgi:hypothetical protein
MEKRKITFKKIKDARTGNILFQYLFCKLVCLKFGCHEYTSYEYYQMSSDDFVITQDNFKEIQNENFKEKIKGKNVLCDGYFQCGELYTAYRHELIELMHRDNDYWYDHKNRKKYIRDFLECKHELNLSEGDVVVSLRLDDFMHYGSPTSNLIPPSYYIDILDGLKFDKLYVVCDTIRHDWEKKYIEFFRKFNPVIVQKDLMHDCAVFRDCNTLIHSNSTLCWFMSFLSKSKKRFIPNTNFYQSQKLEKIEESDIITNIEPLKHYQAQNLNSVNYVVKSIIPLPYSIPDEYVVNTRPIKYHILADLIPGKTATYRFGVDDEAKYYDMYKHSLFAFTCKKGGWDCLRHYEIMASGCIPIFEELDQCPKSTMTSFPKELIIQANKNLLPWKDDKLPLYQIYLDKMLEHVKNHCTVSATAKQFLRKMEETSGKKIKNVLVLTGHTGVNYTRETLLIGLKRHLNEIDGLCYEYPKLDFLYQDYTGDRKSIHGNGYTYSMKLQKSDSLTEDEIKDKIKSKYWDIVVYGKVGPDEQYGGSLETFQLWDIVSKVYTKKEIAFLYGGDGCQNIHENNAYKFHVLRHAMYGNCFVRELIM